MQIIKWLYRAIPFFPEADQELERERRTSKRSWREYKVKWLQYFYGKDFFEDARMVFQVGHGYMNTYDKYKGMVEEYIRLADQLQFEEIEGLTEKHIASFKEMENDKFGFTGVYGFDIYVWMCKDGAVNIRMIETILQREKIFYDKKNAAINPFDIKNRKLVYPV